MVQYQLISYTDDADYIPKEVAIMCIKTEGSGISGRACCFEGLAIPQIGLAINIIALPTKESLHVYEHVGRKKALAVF